MVMNQRLKFKTYIVIYTKKVWSKFHSNMITEEEMVQAAKCHSITFLLFKHKFWLGRGNSRMVILGSQSLKI